jgi:DNA-binding NarL/FixJ family response regulator
MTPYGIVLADDHVLFRRGVRKIIERVDGLEVVGEANDGLELLQLLKHKTPALVILDISMPNLRGLEAAREIKVLYPRVKILLLTMHKTKKFLQQGLEAGVDGFLVKEDADTELLQAIQAIKGGGKFYSPLLSAQLAELASQKGIIDPLTQREKEVAKLLAEGKSNKEIADLLYISIYTVRRHRARIMRKLELKGLADMVRYAVEQGYISDNS